MNTEHQLPEAPPTALHLVAERLKDEVAAIEATVPGSPDRLALKGVDGRLIASRPNDNYHVTRARAIAAKLEGGEPLAEIRAEAARSNFFTSALLQALRGAPSQIIQIRGPSGSGKTTLVRQLMEKRGHAVPIERPGKKRRYEGYQVGPGLRIVGDYRRICGGAEGMKLDEIDRVVREYARHGSVIVEGLFISASVGRWMQLAIDHADVVFAFLRPPLDICIERVHARRAAAGRPKPFNPRLAELWPRLDLHFRRFRDEAGAQCVWLPWEDPLPTLEAILDGTYEEPQA